MQGLKEGLLLIVLFLMLNLSQFNIATLRISKHIFMLTQIMNRRFLYMTKMEGHSSSCYLEMEDLKRRSVTSISGGLKVSLPTMIYVLVCAKRHIQYFIYKTRSHDNGTKLCGHKMNTVATVHMMRFNMLVSSLFFPYLNFTLITVDSICPSQNVSSNRNETLTVTCSHSTEMVEFRYGFKLLWLALRFHIFSCRYRVS